MSATLRTQATGAASGVPDVVATLTGVQTGDLLALCLYERDGVSIVSIGDSVNGAWTLAATRALVAARVAVYYLPNSAAGNPVVTATLGGTTPRDINVSAWSGVQTASPLDTTGNAGNSAVTSHLHGSVTPSASSLLITCLGSTDHGGVSALDAGFVALNIDAGVTNTNRRVYAYKVGHTGAVNPTHVVNSSSNSDAIVAAFLESVGGGGAALRPVFTRMGARRL